MLNQEQAKKAADLIYEHWQNGEQMTALPDELRPGSREEGYAVQAHLGGKSARPLFGWKIAATSEGGQCQEFRRQLDRRRINLDPAVDLS